MASCDICHDLSIKIGDPDLYITAKRLFDSSPGCLKCLAIQDGICHFYPAWVEKRDHPGLSCNVRAICPSAWQVHVMALRASHPEHGTSLQDSLKLELYVPGGILASLSVRRFLEICNGLCGRFGTVSNRILALTTSIERIADESFAGAFITYYTPNRFQFISIDRIKNSLTRSL